MRPTMEPGNEGHNKESTGTGLASFLQQASTSCSCREAGLVSCVCPSLADPQCVKFEILYPGDETVCRLLCYFEARNFNRATTALSSLRRGRGLMERTEWGNQTDGDAEEGRGEDGGTVQLAGNKGIMRARGWSITPPHILRACCGKPNR